MEERARRVYVFDAYRVDPEERLLLCGEEPIALTPKAFDTLLMLLERSGRVVAKDELMRQLWPDTFVEEANLANNISILRDALGGGGKDNPYIKTVARRGYRFVAPVRELRAELDASAQTLLERHTLTSVVIEQEEQDAETAAAPDAAHALLPAAPSRWARVRALLGARRVLLPLSALVALLVGLGAGLWWGKRVWLRAPASFQQLTFRRGLVTGARFTPDGQTIIYSAMWAGGRSVLFTTRPESPESRALGIDDALLLSLSRQGEMALLIKPRVSFFNRGTLARLPLAGGAPREVLQDVQDADWSPDGRELAVIHWVGGACRLEYPIGQVRYELQAPGWLSHVRVAPDGAHLAFLEHPAERFDDRGAVNIIDLAGQRRTLSHTYVSANGLNWSPAGDELWYTASDGDLNNSLDAVDLRGHERLLARAAGRLNLFDISTAGRALVTREDARIGMIVAPPGADGERELSWLDGSFLRAISADGRTLLFDEENIGGGATAAVYLRATDGAPALRLGEGHALALSPDGRWVLARRRFTTPPQLVLLPTGAGDARTLDAGAITYQETGAWFPDGEHLLLVGHEEGHGNRCYVYDLGSGQARAVTPEGSAGRIVSPDGRWVVARARQGDESKLALYLVAGGEARPLVGVEAQDLALNFSADGRALYVAQGELPARVYRIDLATGRRELWREIMPADPTGILTQTPPHITPDARAYAYTYFRVLSDLYLVDGLK